MNTETKDLLRSIGTNASGTVIGAGVIAVLIFFAGKINLLTIYWKEITLSLILIFLVLTLVVWFRKLLSLEKELDNIKRISGIDRETEVIKDMREYLIQTMKAVSSGNVASLKRMIIELEILQFRNNHQVGELSKLIEKLHIDIGRDWEVRGTLMEIREYIKEKGMPYYYIEDLNKVLKLVEKDFSVLSSEIATLSQEKLYKL
jgi:hypothetical protein